MLHLARKLSQSSTTSNTFSVFEDSQDEFDVIDKQNVEVQTEELEFSDATENTAISIPLESQEAGNHDLFYWASVAKLKFAELREVREENDKIQTAINLNVSLKEDRLEEYAKLFSAAASVLEDGNDEEDSPSD